MAELMKQGRRRVAELMSREINSGRGTRRLASVLDTLLKSDDGEFDDEKADWCFWLMAGGDTPEDFLKILQQNNTSSVCGLVWNAHFVAYRCRDCAISPCMSLCADCFQNGNHEGHDFNMFRSQAGGACDCGDENVMRKQGFCTSHGSERKRQTILIPEQMLTSAKFIIPRLILKIYDDLQMARSEHEIYRLPEKLPQLLKFLSKISEADILRDIIGQAILSPIDELISLASNHASASIKLQPTKPTSPTSGPPLPHGIPHNMMQVAGTDFPIPASSAVPNYISDEEPESLDCISSRSESATSSIKIEGTFVTFLDFLMHILVKSEFASSLATFMLQLLPDPSYKVAFTRSFCRHYSAIGKSLCQSVQPEKLSNNLVHVSVQLFSSDVLAKLMVHEENALHTLVTVLIDMINSCATIMPYEATPAGDSDLCLTTVSVPVACCRNFILSKHCYWPITSDLINVLSHKDIVEIFLNDDALIEQWMTLVKLVTAMNRNRRELLTHLEFEPSTYITSFSVEFESVVAVMWELVRGCVKLNDKGIYCVKMIRATEKALQQWYSVVPFMPKKIDLTFHLALHRYLALFVSQAINRFGVDESEAVPSADLLAKWMEYPLRTLVGCNEIKCGLWVYNGYQIRGQAQSYVQCHFCNSMIDLDIFFVQMAASKLDPDYFLTLLIERFSLNSWFHFGKLVASDSKLSNLEKEKQTAEGFLSFILTLLSQRVFSGASDLEQCKKDLSALLCVANKTHSQLHETIPSKPGESSETTQNFEIALREMADFQAPTLDTDKMQQGTYTPKDIVWDDSFDYSHIQLRCYSTPDHQTALERYTNNMQQRGLTTHAHCWPPMKNLSPIHPAFKGLYRILQSDVLHKILVFVIHRAVTSINDVTEPMLITVVHLLQLAVRYPSATISKGFIPPVETTDKRTRNVHKCLDFLEKHAKDRKMLYGTGDRELLELNKNLYDRMNQGHEISFESSIEDVVTILQHEVFSHGRNSVFSIVLSYTNESFFRKEVAKTYFNADPVKALEIFLSLESQETHQLFKRLFGHWKKCSELDGVEITDYAFVKQRAQQERDFPQIMTLFVDNYDVLLRIRDTPPNTPATVFDIEYDAASIVENSSKSVCGKIQRIDTASASSEGCSDAVMTSTEEAPIEAQENLISLLAQLLARLSQGSKNTPCKKLRENEALKEPVAGDGSYHVTELLVSLAETNRINEQLVNRLCPSISERNCVKKKRGDSDGDNQSYKEDRRKRAMARQQKILAEFMSKQEVFRDQVIAQETNMEGVEEGDTQTSRMDESYDCVICGQASPSTYDRPIGVATLMQPTTVLSKRRRESDYHELPDQKNESEYQTSGVLLEKRKKAITQTFDGVAAARSLEVGLDCGVFVQTCCHYIHIDCHQSYIKSLQEERSRSFGYENNMFDITKGFFTCPLCRQPCNGVVPILPDVLRKRDSKQTQKDFLESAIDVTKLLQKYSEPGSMSLLTAKALEFTILTASSATFVTSLIIALRRDGHPSTSIYANRTIKEKFVILISTFRSCLELEYINICNESRTLGSKRSCLAFLFEILQFHSQSLQGPTMNVWTRLMGDQLQSMGCGTTQTLDSSLVPLIFNDAFTILLEFVLTWPTWITEVHFRCLVKALYNLVIVQALFILSFKIKQGESRMFESIGQNLRDGANLTASDILGVVCASVSRVRSRFGVSEEDTGISQSILTPQAIELKIQEFCVPFLRMAAMLSTVLLESEFSLNKDHDEFANLALSLGLRDNNNMEQNAPPVVCATDLMHWRNSNGSTVVRAWCEKACDTLRLTSTTDLNLLPLNQVFPAPRLLPLPEAYDSLFQYYRKQKCQKCDTIPSESTLCLVCGAFICFRSACCANSKGVYECVQHSIDCGCGTGIFLLVSSSSILVIRSERASLWGSVYLDRFGEEDRELKRGKPLFLSRQRYHRLEQQWLSHSFDRSCKKWGWHGNRF